MEETWKDRVSSRPITSTDPDLIRLLDFKLGRDGSERMHCVFVGPDHHYIGDEKVSEGSADSVQFPAKALLRRAIGLGAAGIILAHNHPSGDCAPSHTDIRETERFAGIAMAVGIALIDHLIFASGSVFSMGARRKL